MGFRKIRNFLSGRFVFIMFWLLGLSCGMLIAYFNQVLLKPMLMQATGFRVSAVSLMLHFTICIYLMSSEGYRLRSCYLLVFIKSILVGFAVCLVSIAFGPSGWLVRCLFLFSECLYTIFFLYVSIMKLGYQRTFSAGSYLFAVGFHLSVGLLDYYLVSDFTAFIFTHT